MPVCYWTHHRAAYSVSCPLIQYEQQYTQSDLQNYPAFPVIKMERCLHSARDASSPFTLQHSAKTSAAHLPEQRAPQAEAAARHPPQQQRRQRSKMPRAEAARREHTAAGLVIKTHRIVSVTVCSAPALSEERWLVPG